MLSLHMRLPAYAKICRRWVLLPPLLPQAHLLVFLFPSHRLWHTALLPAAGRYNRMYLPNVFHVCGSILPEPYKGLVTSNIVETASQCACDAGNNHKAHDDCKSQSLHIFYRLSKVILFVDTYKTIEKFWRLQDYEKTLVNFHF